MMVRILTLLGLVLACWPAFADSPVAAAAARTQATFAQKPSVRFPIDQAVLDATWQTPPFDQKPYTYTFEEIRANWDHFMRGLKIPYPSAEYLKDRYTRYPQFMHTLGYQDTDWEMHSLNTLETWQAYLRGDFERAYRLGKKYGGYSLIPAIFGEILQGVYLARTNTEKKAFLQDAINQIREINELMPVLPGDEAMAREYVLMRLGYSYALGRLVEDAPVPSILANGYLPQVINAATEGLAVDPDHPLTLAMNAAFDANVIRRVGRGVGYFAMEARPVNAETDFNRAMELVDDIAIVRYEYANSLLYIDKATSADLAQRQLQEAAQMKSLFSMEALDVLYARKRLQEVRAWRESGMSFDKFDRKRRKFMEKNDANLYSVVSRPFLVN